MGSGIRKFNGASIMDLSLRIRGEKHVLVWIGGVAKPEHARFHAIILGISPQGSLFSDTLIRNGK